MLEFVLQACNFIIKRLQHECCPVSIATFLRTPFFIDQLRRLLLSIQPKQYYSILTPVLDQIDSLL